MQLNENGTITVTLGGNDITLRSPTYGELKILRRQSNELQEFTREQVDTVQSKLTAKQALLLEIARKGSKQTEEDKEAWDKAPKKDLDAVTAVINELNEIPDQLMDRIAEWWTEVIELLGDTVKPDLNAIPAGLVNGASMSLFFNHVETTPFLSGPQ